MDLLLQSLREKKENKKNNKKKHLDSVFYVIVNLLD